MINQGSSFFLTKEEPFLSSGGSTFMFQASPSVRQIVEEGGGWGGIEIIETSPTAL